MVGDGFQSKIRKAHTCACARAMTGIPLNLLECISPTLTDLSPLTKRAVIPSSNIVMGTAKVNEGADGDNSKCWVTGHLQCLSWTQHNEIQI